MPVALCLNRWTLQDADLGKLETEKLMEEGKVVSNLGLNLLP